MLETPARARSWVLAVEARRWKAFAAVLADGRVSRVGTVRVERVYDRPWLSVSI